MCPSHSQCKLARGPRHARVHHHGARPRGRDARFTAPQKAAHVGVQERRAQGAPRRVLKPPPEPLASVRFVFRRSNVCRLESVLCRFRQTEIALARGCSHRGNNPLPVGGRVAARGLLVLQMAVCDRGSEF